MALLKPRYPHVNWGDPLARGLVGAWTLSEGAGTAFDATGNRGTGTLSGTSSWTNGSYGSALSFGGGQLSCGQLDSSPLNFTGAWSIVALCYPTASGSYMHVIGRQSATSTRQYALFIDPSQNAFIVCGGAGSATITLSPQPTLNAWNLITVTCTALGVTRVYIGPTFAGSGTMSSLLGSLAASGQTMLMGAETGNANPLTGAIALGEVYNRIVAPSEVTQRARDPFAIYRPRSKWWRNAVAAPAASSIVHRRTLGQRTGSRAA